MLAAIAAVPLLAVLVRCSPRLGWLDVPVARSAHRVPVPRAGGLGIIGAIVIAAIAGPSWWSASQWIGLGLLAVVGFADDIWNLPATPRLVTHLAAAALLVSGHAGEGGWLWQALGVLWIAAFINAFNFMDGIDGIAGLHAGVAGGMWFAAGLTTDVPALAAAGGAVAGASVAFLRVNWAPARIFMGDAGATFLGAALASMPWVTPTPERWFAPAVVVLAPFWFDAGVTLLGRMRQGAVLYAGHQEHFYQRLVNAGLRHATVAAGYGVMTAIAGAGALAAQRVRWPQTLATVAAVGLGMTACALALKRAARDAGERPPRHRTEVSGPRSASGRPEQASAGRAPSPRDYAPSDSAAQARS